MFVVYALALQSQKVKRHKQGYIDEFLTSF